MHLTKLVTVDHIQHNIVFFLVGPIGRFDSVCERDLTNGCRPGNCDSQNVSRFDPSGCQDQLCPRLVIIKSVEVALAQGSACRHVVET